MRKSCVLANQKFRKSSSYVEGTCGNFYCNLLLTARWTFGLDTWTWVSPTFMDGDFPVCIGNLLQLLVKRENYFSLFLKEIFNRCNLSILWLLIIIVFCSPLFISRLLQLTFTGLVLHPYLVQCSRI